MDMMNRGRAAVIILLVLLLMGSVAARSIKVPPGLTAVDREEQEEEDGAGPTGAAVERGPPWLRQDNGGLNWATIGLSVAVSLLLIGILLVLYRYVHRQQPVQVQTDEEAVLAILDEETGTVKQPDIRDRLDWSAAKVSRVTTRLEEAGRIEKVRLGRENVIRRTT